MVKLCYFRSQFGDIYQEDYFIDYLKPDIRVVKELPLELQSLDLEAMGSMVRLITIYLRIPNSTAFSMRPANR